jgi:hypothetical protein
MSSVGAAPRAAVPVSNARAEASRKNGARSRGPKTPEGRARSARNALTHGLRAQKHVVLPDEDGTEFAALEAALRAELAPAGALQALLAERIAAAAWRLARADRIEAELLVYRCGDDGDLALALVRDGNGTRSFETLLRYRGAAMAELMRALRTLEAVQAKRGAPPVRAAEPAAVLAFEPKRGRAGATLRAPAESAARSAAREKNPDQPEPCSRPGDPASAEPPWPGPEQLRSGPAPARPNEPEARRNPGGPRPAMAQRSPSGTSPTRAGGAW